jgi:beta-galactosidase
MNKGVSLTLTHVVPAEGWKRSVFNGLAQVIVQAGTEPGEIRLTAHAQGLTGNTVAIEGKGRPPRPQAPR